MGIMGFLIWRSEGELQHFIYTNLEAVNARAAGSKGEAPKRQNPHDDVYILRASVALELHLCCLLCWPFVFECMFGF